jgi:signal transduction histidine kinase
LDPALPKLQVDAQLLRQALVNVLNNALEAMPRGGSLTIEARRQEREGRSWARISIRDTGQGVPPELLPRVFEPFFTTKASGTGVGLAIVKRVVEAHGGKVEAHCGRGRGMTVALWLPLPSS